MRINPDILQIIEAGHAEDNLYFLPPEQLPRKTYEAVNKVLNFLGGKWNRKQKAHVFDKPIEEAIDNVVLTGSVRDLKKEFQFFETPPKVADGLVTYAEVKPHHFCFEPSAGGGNIARALAKIVGKDNIDCLDIQPDLLDSLKKEGFCIFPAQNFLNLNPSSPDIDQYARIVMNPPFTRQQDLEHVEHALGFLKPGGILVSIMSPSIQYRTNKKTLAFLNMLSAYRHETKSLPEGTFKMSGTLVSTIILKVWK